MRLVRRCKQIIPKLLRKMTASFAKSIGICLPYCVLGQLEAAACLSIYLPLTINQLGA